MNPILATMAGAMLTVLLASGCTAPSAPVAAAPAQDMTVHDIPHAIRLSHAEALERLTDLTHHRGAVGAAATKALALVQAHFQREEQYIMPPLALAHDLSEGKINPNMRWAVAMADRIKADREVIFREHAQITDAMNELLAAAQRAHDKAAEEAARDGVIDSFEDMELNEPMAIIIGEYLRLRLPPQ